MARSIGAIITIAGAVAVNAIPGLGQLASAAILVGTAAASAAISSLAGRPTSKPETTESNIKSPLPPRVDAFGISRLPGSSLVHP